MRRVVRIAASQVLFIVLALCIVHVAAAASSAQDDAVRVDLANVPLMPDELSEPGFQVMTGGFLDRDATAAWLAAPRREEVSAIADVLEEHGWERTYALDLVLLEDRAYAESAILALVQTNLFAFADVDGAEAAYASLSDFRSNPDAEAIDPSVVDGATARIVTESGDTLRTIARVDAVIIEVVSLEEYRQADLAVHDATVMATLDRFVAERDAGTPGIATEVLVVEDGPEVADLFNAPGTGVHQLYRVRDGVVQVAAGELEPPDLVGIAPGLTELYQASQSVRLGGGAGFYSSWIGTFDDPERAASFVSALPSASAGTLLPDPFFPMWGNEDVVAQGVAGVYRVTGTANGERFSGTMEIRQEGARVVGIGWRVLGDALPSVDVTSRMMDAQLACFGAMGACAPMSVSAMLDQGSATPVAAVPRDRIESAQFGWSVAIDPFVWAIGERQVDSGYDYVEMQADRSRVTFESVIDQHGDAPQCIVDELHTLQELEEHAVIELGSDVAGEQSAGMETGHAWAIYTVEPLAEERADQEYTIRIDCYTLVAGSASLVMTHTAPRDLWAAEQPKGDLLREGITIPVGQKEPGALAVERTSTWRHTHAMIDRIWIDLAA